LCFFFCVYYWQFVWYVFFFCCFVSPLIIFSLRAALCYSPCMRVFVLVLALCKTIHTSTPTYTRTICYTTTRTCATSSAANTVSIRLRLSTTAEVTAPAATAASETIDTINNKHLTIRHESYSNAVHYYGILLPKPQRFPPNDVFEYNSDSSASKYRKVLLHHKSW